MRCATRISGAADIRLDVSGREEAICEVTAAQLGRASRVAIKGRDVRGGQKVFIHVVGGGGRGRGGDRPLTLSAVGFDGFVPALTVLSFCNVPRVVVDNVGIPAAVFATQTDVSGPAGHIHGTAVVRSFRGGVQFRHAPYRCDE